MPRGIDEFGAELVRIRQGAGPDHQSEMRSLERLYARAIDAQVQAERARDDARAECQRLLEENRALRAAQAFENWVADA